MEFIQQHDWTCMSVADSEHFVTAEDLDNCCTEKILRNKFFDPLISSESDDEQPKNSINWDQVFAVAKKNKEYLPRVYVPGFRPNLHHPKLSALSTNQHYQCLKVICAQYPNVLEAVYMPRPTKLDYSLFEDIKHIYVKEQKEFIEWAKAQWVSTHCLRALKPKPLVEIVYEAEFNMKEKELQSLPKTYEMAAQLPLVTQNDSFEFVHQKDLITVNPDDLPNVQFPDMFTKKVTILQSCSPPKPCEKHPCRFVLPGEKAVTVLPLTEVHRSLAQYALRNGAQYIASESALQCLVASHRAYLLPVTVSSVIDADGESQNIVVLGSEFSLLRQSSLQRTYRAFRHLLEYSLISPQEKARVLLNRRKVSTEDNAENNVDNALEADDDDDEDNLVIVMDTMESKSDTDPQEADLEMAETEADNVGTLEPENSKPSEAALNSENTKKESQKAPDKHSCTCEGTWYENPPPRSFRKWQVRSKTRKENFDLIVHCSHKIRGKTGEVILEPIPEYQLDLGASEQPIEKIRSLALSLYLRRNATVMNVRVEGTTGDLVSYEDATLQGLEAKLPDFAAATSNKLHTLLNQLQGLLPGSYLLKHEPEHGDNALLYVSRAGGSLTLQWDSTQLAEADEAKSVKRAPQLAPVLLPSNKFQKILPCAFTPFPRQVARDSKKPPQRQRTPPQALKVHGMKTHHRGLSENGKCVRSKTRKENLDLIVHCSHKIRRKNGEVILEPIPEYQLDLGASEQPIEKLGSLALSLYLRRNTTVINVA